MNEHDALSDAFSKFSEASARLEQKYQQLLEETAVLREALRAKDLEMKRRERLATLGETAAAIAHEVRNPLGAIKLFVSILKKDLCDRPDSVALIDQIDTSINALDHVVTNILQFSRDRSINFAPVNLHAIIQEQVHAFPRTESNQATFELVLNASGFLLGHDGSLRQVFYNLILNALQATSYRGHVHIETTDFEGGTRVVVQDTGAGVPVNLLDRIFEPFVTSKNEGTGLGLAIVKQIVEAHGGTISARNGPGAIIEIILPKQGKQKGV